MTRRRANATRLTLTCVRRALINDLFPGAKLTDARNEALEKALAEAAAACKMELTQQQIDRMLQLHLACEQRIGVIIVGPSGSGKSTLWELLEKAYERLGRKPIVYKMNPKAMPRQQLLGSMNMDTREWSDGVLTAAARKVVKEPLEQRSWIICDGDVDPEWIESLNSVLDDNRLLTMPNGERIQFANNVNFIFECHSLEFASPATVSRCGMLFMSDEAMEVERMLQRWLKVQATDNGDPGQMQSWMNDFFDKVRGGLRVCSWHTVGRMGGAGGRCAVGTRETLCWRLHNDTPLMPGCPSRPTPPIAGVPMGTVPPPRRGDHQGWYSGQRAEPPEAGPWLQAGIHGGPVPRPGLQHEPRYPQPVLQRHGAVSSRLCESKALTSRIGSGPGLYSRLRQV